jgi:hypothetical protein
MTSVAPRRKRRINLLNTEFSFLVQSDYLHVTLSGPYPVEREILEVIRDHAEKVARAHILVDGLGLADPRTDLDRFWLGKTVADVFGHRYKIAALVRKELITHATENTAVNRGARMFVTDDERLALSWLGE